MAGLRWLLLLILAAPALAAAPSDADGARRARFAGFLAEATQLYAAAGARPQPARARFGYMGADLLDPRVVRGELAHAPERYASYRQLLATAPPIAGTDPILPRPPGSLAPEQIQSGVDDGRRDASPAIAAALARGDLWLSPGRRYRLTSPLVVPTHRRILSDGTGTLLVDLTAPGFPDRPFDPAHGHSGFTDVIQLHGVSDVQLRDFRLQTPIATTGPQPLLHGIDIRKASNVLVTGVELRGFPRAQGMIRLNSVSDVRIARNLLHASYTRELTRQVTGIELDESRVGSDSQRVTIEGNLVLGLLLDPAVYLDRSLRGGQPLNDETTGIALARTGPAPAIRVDRNVVADVGQGIDLFVSGAGFDGNVIERTPEFGLKMGHGASDNRFSGFRITASGIAAVLIYASPGQPATGNQLSDFAIDHPGAVWGIQPHLVALEVTVNGGDGQPADAAVNGGNLFRRFRITGVPRAGTPGWGATILCDTGRSPAPPNRFVDVHPDDMVGGGHCLVDQGRG